MDDAAHNPATIPAPGSYHGTPRLQRDFLEAFATNRSVKISATIPLRHPSEHGIPLSSGRRSGIPAFAGMTRFEDDP